MSVRHGVYQCLHCTRRPAFVRCEIFGRFRTERAARVLVGSVLVTCRCLVIVRVLGPAGSAPVHIAAPTPRCHVSKCSISVARGPGGLLLFSTSRILAHHRHPGIRFPTHPQHARAHGRRTGSVLHCTQCHTRRSRSSPPSVCHRARATFLSFMHGLARRSHCRWWSCSTHGVFLFFFGVPTLFLAGCSFFLLLATHCAARHARLHACTFASPRTDDRRTNDATCGPQAWLTGSLH